MGIVFSPTHEVRAQVYSVETLLMEDGLISDHVNSMAQDEDGFLWVSTDRGLVRFDGDNWVNYPTSKEIPLIVSTSLSAQKKRVFLSGVTNRYGFKLFYLEEGAWHDTGFKDSIYKKMDHAWVAYEGREDTELTLLLRDTLHTFRLHDKQWESRPLPLQLSGKIHQLQYHDQHLLLLGADGLYREEQGQFVPYKIHESLQPEQIGKLSLREVVFTDSSVVAISRYHLWEWREDRLHLLYENRKDPTGILRELELHPSGLVVFRDDLRFFKANRSEGEVQAFLTTTEDARAFSSRLFMDEEGTLWISSYRGLHYLPNFSIMGFLDLDLPTKEVTLIHEFAPHTFLVGSRFSYAVIKDNKVVYRHAFSKDMLSNIRFISATVHAGELYIAMQDAGLGRFNTKDYSIERLSTEGQSVVSAYSTGDTLWVKDNKNTLWYLHNDQLVSKYQIYGYPRSMRQLGDSLLIATNFGLITINSGHIRAYSKAAWPTLYQLYSMAVINDSLYFGTENGLAAWDNEKFVSKSLWGFKLNNAVYTQLVSAPDEVWLGTDDGVYSLSPNRVHHLNARSGLIGSEVNRGALIKAQSGKIMIGTNKGLNIYNPEEAYPVGRLRPPSVEYISVNNTRQKVEGKPIEMGHDNYALAFIIEWPNLLRRPVPLRYQLEGYDIEWQYSTGLPDRSIDYGSLPSGEYIFRLQYHLPDGNWADMAYMPELKVSKPFYLQASFIVISVILVGFVGYLISQMISQNRLNKNLQTIVKNKIAEIERNEAKLNLALDNAKMGVWTIDLQEMRVELSAEVYRLLGLTLGTVVTSEDFLAMMHPLDRDKMVSVLTEAIKNNEPYDFEFRIRHVDGSLVWLHGKGKAIVNDCGRTYRLSGTLSDISRRKEIEKDRERLISELKHTNEELDRFVYSVSHDLSAPTKSIKGLINLLRMQKLSPEMESYITLMDKSIDKQDTFIREILDYAYNARSESKLEYLPLTQVVQEILDSIPDEKNTAQLVCDIDKKCTLYSDRMRLKIVLSNLITNAFKYKNLHQEAEHFVRITCKVRGTQFELNVEDNGIGIREEDQEKIFKMFYRATDLAPGTGLGLYIAKDAADKLGYTISLESVYGKGSRFTVKGPVQIS
ncbi:ATP-binding protein [Cytophagales bacterium LB-30]|uniref:histidine kinase n=1 Tax=Shiella aurantiaca TaxID=3058365 RepID=A0ABT8F6Q9_9BACT|nr:ATP-binding protein [Shiella aurantiaca]MDN4166055.1 ATP-binding protein [Shiella aurantiaca]